MTIFIIFSKKLFILSTLININIETKKMGGGGLRILPHKTWNVYGYEQRKRVEDDERREKKRLEKLGNKEARNNVK